LSAPAQTIFPSFEAATESKRLRRNELSVAGLLKHRLFMNHSAKQLLLRGDTLARRNHIADRFGAGVCGQQIGRFTHPK
jgi:hypothetical protein